VLRAGKLLASSTWMGENYRMLYTDSGALLDALDRSRVSHVLLDDSASDMPPHDAQLRAALGSSSRWNERSVGSHTGQLKLFQRTDALPPGRPEIDLDMSYSLGRRLVY